MKRKETLRGPGGIRVELDAGEIFPDDPGQGTPAMVILPTSKREFTGTFWCSLWEEEVDGSPLPKSQVDWLASIEEAVDQWVDLRTVAMKRDGRDAVLAVLN